MDKERLKRHIQKSDLTALEKRYLENLVNRDGWIPCSERMPEDMQEVMFACADWERCKDGFFEGESKVFCDSKFGHIYENITHWMPLPEPPEDTP